MEVEGNLRIDKWLWAVRIFKTRSKAAEACKKGKVLIQDIAIKPSRIVNLEDIVVVKKTPVIYSYRVLKLLGKRLSAKLIEGSYENLTPKEEIEKLMNNKLVGNIYRERGSGRPTKRERRIIDKYRDV